MGYQLPDYDPRLRAVSAPVKDAGPTATGDAFGASNARDLFEFGGAVGEFGRAVTHVADIKQERTDNTKVRDDMVAANRDYRAWKDEMMATRKGMAAKDLAEDGRKWWEERRKQIESGLQNNRQRDLFAPQFVNRMESSLETLDRYSFDEVQRGQQLSRDAQNEEFIRESESDGIVNDHLVEDNRQLAHLNIRANLQGQSDDVVTSHCRTMIAISTPA